MLICEIDISHHDRFKDTKRGRPTRLAMSTSLFLIIGRSGEPLYELDTSGHKSDDAQHLNQFIAHSALDLVELAAWTTR